MEIGTTVAYRVPWMRAYNLKYGDYGRYGPLTADMRGTVRRTNDVAAEIVWSDGRGQLWTSVLPFSCVKVVR